MGKSEIEKVVGLIDKALSDIENEQVLSEVKADVGELCASFPLVVGEERPA
jgi:glycine/serine hydroxymethyltransferase